MPEMLSALQPGEYQKGSTAPLLTTRLNDEMGPVIVDHQAVKSFAAKME
ncbi:hypothetical protein XIS1_130009 [Xenorhabdus innexi]|uniref:Uncharacterized protein n=1 Tax=Xenorhabdus innexi TaxID=290109 RepID=A0A1N6MSX8_9GAMM|nr:hypothetical protein XIS1_130009 [Xenorhabdus innexi]